MNTEPAASPATANAATPSLPILPLNAIAWLPLCDLFLSLGARAVTYQAGGPPHEPQLFDQPEIIVACWFTQT